MQMSSVCTMMVCTVLVSTVLVSAVLVSTVTPSTSPSTRYLCSARRTRDGHQVVSAALDVDNIIGAALCRN